VSAFVFNRVKTYVTSISITVQSLVVLCHTVCEYVGGPKNLRDAGAPFPQERGTADLLETRFIPLVLPRQIWSF